MQIFKHRLILLSVLGLGLLSACKKEVSGNNLNPTPTTPPTQPSTSDLVKDTTLAYSKDIYLWYTQIPGSFNARGYDDPDKIMTALRQYSMEPNFSKPVDRWSFAMKKSEWDNVSSGVSGDFGLNVFFRDKSDLRVKYVESASPAGKAGIRRGWRIVKINGSTNITTDNANAIVQDVFYSTSTSFTFQKPDNSTVDITLNTGSYQEHPIMLDTVYSVDAKKVGYMVFNSFLGDTKEIEGGFNRVFNRFTSAGVNDVVIDLRYNGGGYVSLQETLANYLAPAAANGNVMMKQQFNNKYASWDTTTNFSKQGALNLSRVFFIVSKSTASASELLINNLKPYVEAILVGPDSTYGKPVGFFPIPVGDWYIFPVSFRTINKAGNGSYFGGLPLTHKVADGLDKDWGDLNESCLNSVMSYITTGNFRMIAPGRMAPAYIEPPAVRSGNEVLDRPSFKGAIGRRERIKF